MEIRKPVGSILMSGELPDGSYVHVIVMAEEDGFLSLRFEPVYATQGRYCPLTISIRDMAYIMEWVQQP